MYLLYYWYNLDCSYKSYEFLGGTKCTFCNYCTEQRNCKCRGLSGYRSGRLTSLTSPTYIPHVRFVSSTVCAHIFLARSDEFPLLIRTSSCAPLGSETVRMLYLALAPSLDCLKDPWVNVPIRPPSHVFRSCDTGEQCERQVTNGRSVTLSCQTRFIRLAQLRTSSQPEAGKVPSFVRFEQVEQGQW